MAMSRKDYSAAAAIIAAELEGAQIMRDAGETVRAHVATAVAVDIAVGLGVIFAADNGRFCRQTFYSACGIADPWNPRAMVTQ